MRRPLTLLWIAMTLLTLPRAVAADDWASPTAKTVQSPSAAYSLTLTPPEPGSADVAYPVAVLEGPDGKVEFTLKTPWMAVDAYVFDDGRVLTLDEWFSVGLGDFVAVFYSAKGERVWSKTLEELLGEGLANQAPRSISSRWWRAAPAEVEIRVDREAGTTLLLTLWNEDRLELRLTDGSATIVTVKDVGDDPERLMRRARALKDEDKLADAASLYAKVVEVAPEQLDAYLEWGETLQRQGEVKAAIEVLERAVARFGEQAPPEKTYNYANLHVNLGKLYLEAGNKKAARGAYERSTHFERNYDYPALAYAGFLFDEGENAAADEVLAGFLEGTEEAYRDMMTRGVGDCYKEHKQLEKARDTYLLVYDAEKMQDQFLYMSLAEVYEALGEGEKALVVWKQLSKYFDEMGPAYEWYLEQAREHVARLSKK